jgi:hypothetical protein
MEKCIKYFLICLVGPVSSGLAKLLACSIVLILSGCAIQGTTLTVKREHYDPAYLNQSAMAALAVDDRSTALILLERAARLAPHDQQILDNLAVLKNHPDLPVRSIVPYKAIPQAMTIGKPLNQPSTGSPSERVAPEPPPIIPTNAIWPLP